MGCGATNRPWSARPHRRGFSYTHQVEEALKKIHRQGLNGALTMSSVCLFICLHPGRFTWNLQITHLKRKMIFQTSMIMFHLNLPGCICLPVAFCSCFFFGGGGKGRNFGSRVTASSTWAPLENSARRLAAGNGWLMLALNFCWGVMLHLEKMLKTY